MRLNQLIVFDLDDTLIDTSDLYWRTRSAFVELIEPLVTSDPVQIVNTFEEIDSIHIKQDGFTPTRYLKTMLKTYENLKGSDSEDKDDILKAIQDCAGTITSEFPMPIIGARELLDWVFPRFDLALISRGEESLQLKKLDHVGFRKYFRLIEIVQRKSAKTFQDLINNAGFKPSETWVIGDSIQTDINPGIEAGARCIWYNYQHKFYYWRQEHGHARVGQSLIISDLREAIKILEKAPTASKRTDKIDCRETLKSKCNADGRY